MKRRIMATVELMAFVELDIEDEEQLQADPYEVFSDGEVAENAIRMAIREECEVAVYGANYDPVKVQIDITDIRIEGEEQAQ